MQAASLFVLRACSYLLFRVNDDLQQACSEFGQPLPASFGIPFRQAARIPAPSVVASSKPRRTVAVRLFDKVFATFSKSENDPEKGVIFERFSGRVSAAFPTVSGDLAESSFTAGELVRGVTFAGARLDRPQPTKQPSPKATTINYPLLVYVLFQSKGNDIKPE